MPTPSYRDSPDGLPQSVLDSSGKIAEIDDVLVIIEHVLRPWPDACRAMCRKIETRTGDWREIVDAVVAVSHAGGNAERWQNLHAFLRQRANV